ncbi:MAG: GTPase/DUF3482 domain-containing protein [Rhodocyclaceae bacterium]|nr:GTPase/DUF3482 domain-containing protein [Rhodocyclaceae bacterium]
MGELPDLAVVGHTNAGKTSLLRTLTRDAEFGEVSARPATTRHVEGVELMADGRPMLRLYDTPGLEDALGLADLLEALSGNERLDGPEQIERFLASPEARGRFEQEAKVLRQLRASDAALYVIDARDPVLAKYREELAILARCARPLLPILNFVGQPGHRAEAWREMLARVGLHAVVAFDTVAPAVDGERRLYAALATLIEPHRDTLEQLIAARAGEAVARADAARHLIAEMLIDIAAMRRTVAEEAAEPTALGALQDAVRQREGAAADALLGLYGFRREDAPTLALPVLSGRHDDDLFHPRALRDAGVRVGTGAATGAAAGMGIDLVTGGLTLGAAAALGAIAGGLWQTVSHYGERLGDRLRGYRELTVDDAILRLLALRAQALLEALERRGHAATTRLELPAAAAPEGWRDAPLPPALAEARIHPHWSSLSARYTPDEDRMAAAAELARAIRALPAPPASE